MNSFLDFLFPPACVKCGDVGVGLCPDCAGELNVPSQRDSPDGFDDCFALFEYESTGRQVIHELKFRRRRDSLDALTFAMAQLICHVDGDLTWAPTSAVRKHQRGFDQAELLCRGVAHVLDRDVVDLFIRSDDHHQTGLSRADRELGPEFDVRCRPPESLIIVDDVWTTGSTLRSAGYAARSVGAVNVYGLVLASVSSPSAGRHD